MHFFAVTFNAPFIMQGVKTGASYCDICNENCNKKQWIEEQNTEFLFKAYKNDTGGRRDSELRGQEIKIEETWLNTYKETQQL